MNIAKVFLYLLIPICTISCSTYDSSNSNLSDIGDPIADSLHNNEFKVYALPSPMQVSTLMHILDINFNDKIATDVQNRKHQFTLEHYNALNLGIEVIDLGYFTVYNRQQLALQSLTKVESLMKVLGIQSKDDESLLNKFQENIGNKDVLTQLFYEYQEMINHYFEISKNRNIGLYVLTGMYVEGMHIGLQTYINQIDEHKLSFLIKKSMNSLMYQQNIFLDNLIELHETYSDEQAAPLVHGLYSFKMEFEEMNLQTTIDENRITNVKLDIGQIYDLNGKIGEIRDKVVQETLN